MFHTQRGRTPKARADTTLGVGVTLRRGLPVGVVPRTPARPTDAHGGDGTSEATLLAAAAELGEAVGYLPEHGGDLVQNLVPTRAEASRQTSTSSSVELDFHTETAFHPHKPHFLLLLCLRGDPAAATLVCSVPEVLPEVEPWARRTLAEPRFRLGVDESFTGGLPVELAHPVAVLTGPADDPVCTFDANLMLGTDPEADAALRSLRRLVRRRHRRVTLVEGDLLVVDNHQAVHGRGPFPARFDGTDRWLQRTFVVDDLAPSAGERDGRVITTTFA